MKLVITEPAKLRLKEIHDYYKENISEKIAAKIKKGIIQKLKSIRRNPLAGQEEEYLKELGLGHRRRVEGNYKIIYRISRKIIYVTDIFDSRQDPSKMLGEKIE
ncbi:MAG TPA: type II toxin-antitoxin system RelE/ParE family toxin [Chitinophagales bacterium]|nr:type II toxin-antitoxin system RelE/ParE family toxin [Chitinophagales bacterium]